MACLQTLSARHVRNLCPFSIDLHPRQNIIYGRNASGKTSLLETVYILGVAKSFRARQLRHAVDHGRDGLTIHARVQRPQRQPATLIVEHTNSRTILQANGVALSKSSELTDYLPLLFVNTDSHNTIAGGPMQRRRMLDWGVFHVEHDYGGLLYRYQNALKQRNCCLQDGPRTPVPARIWDGELAAHAATIDAARRRYLVQWRPWIDRYLTRLLRRDDIQVTYFRGWPDNADYPTVLQQSLEGDRRLGHTRYGPHRANLEITVDGIAAELCVSRGQQKLLVLALAYAQAAALNAHRGDHCLLLIDDLAAELDAEHRELAMTTLAELGGQSLLAVTEPQLLGGSGKCESRMFHVEHGNIQEVL